MSRSDGASAAGRPASPTDQQRLYRKRRLMLRGGQALMVLGALVMLQHWLFHLEAFGPGQPTGWMDLLSGYPMGGVLLIVGAVLAGSKPKK